MRTIDRHFMFERREDGSIPEHQDRAGYSKHWQYIVQYKTESWPGWHIEGRYARLDTALDAVDKLPYAAVEITQETITKIWCRTEL